MNQFRPAIPEIKTDDPAAASRQAPRSVLWLVALAVAMELLYFWMLGLNNLKEHVETFIPLALAQSLLYCVSVYFAQKLSPCRSTLALIFLAGAAFRLTLFASYPTLSDDLVRYRWEGRAQQAHLNPYLVRPSDPALRYLRDETYPAVSGPDYSTIYGPLVEGVLWADYVLLHGVVAMKLPFVLMDLGVVLVLFRLLPLLGRSPVGAIVYAWSPLVIVEFAASGHNDSLSVLGLVLAILFFHRGQQRLSIAALASSALAKIYSAFLLPVLLLATSLWHVWIPVALSIVAFAPYGERWGDLIRGLSEYGMHWTNNESLYHLIRPLASTDAQAGRIYLAIVAAVIGVCVAKKFPLERAAFWILAAVLLCSPNVFPWYFTWMVPLLAISPSPAWLLLTVLAPLSYHVLIPYGTLGLWQEDHFYTALEYIPFFALWIGSFLFKRFQKRSR
jgi:hypothetical protein